MGISDTLSDNLDLIFTAIKDFIPAFYQPYLTLGIFIILVSMYSIFVWKFYRFLAKRDLLELNLGKYNRYQTGFFKRFFAIVFFIAEYIVVLPIVVFFWFSVVAIILLFLAKEHTIQNILLIAGVLVGSVRVAAYYSEDLSKDIAKLFPFTILAVAVTTPGFLDISDTILKITQITGLFSNVLFYLFGIIVLEFTMRMLYLIMPEIPDLDEKGMPIEKS